MKSRTKRESPPGIRHVIAVASSRGGVGKTTVAVNLSCTLARLGAVVGLFDCDVDCPDVPRMMGMREPVKRADDKLVPHERHGVRFVSVGSELEHQGLRTLRGQLLLARIETYFTGGIEWGELDCLFIDMPSGLSEANLSLASILSLHGALLVITPHMSIDRELEHASDSLAGHGVDVLAVIENMSGAPAKPAPRARGPLLGRIPLEIGLRDACQRGQPWIVTHPSSAVAKAFDAAAQRLVKKMER